MQTPYAQQGITSLKWLFSVKYALCRVHTPKVGFYIVNFFLLFSNKSQKDPTFGFYNLAHSDVTVFHSEECGGGTLVSILHHCLICYALYTATQHNYMTCFTL